MMKLLPNRLSLMKHRVTIQQPSSAPDTYGGSTLGWTDVVSVWASVEALIGREFYAAQQINSEATTKINIRYLAGTISKMRVVYGTRVFDILYVVDPAECHKEMHLVCRELIPLGQ